MRHGKASISDEDRSALLNALVKLRTNQAQILNKYKEKTEYSKISDEIKLKNNSTLLWEIIYLIAAANHSGRNVSVSDVYLSLGISKSTSIRCVTLLEELCILRKTRDPNDRRRAVITLDHNFQIEFVEFLDSIMNELFCIPHPPRR